jgi:hypothetical protein
MKEPAIKKKFLNVWDWNGLMIKFILLFGKLNFSSSLSLILAKRLNTELW